MSTQDTQREIVDGSFVKFIEEYEDCWDNPKVKVGTTGRVVAAHESGVYPRRLDVKLANDTVIKQVPSPFLEKVASPR